MKTLFMLFTLLATLLYASDKKAVYDVSTGDLTRFKQTVLSSVVRNSDYYQNQLQSLHVAMIIHGNAYKFFIKDLKHSPFAQDKELLKEQVELKKRLEALNRFYQVEFYICGSGIKKRHIKKEMLYDFVKITPNATIFLIDRQNEGYAYIPIH